MGESASLWALFTSSFVAATLLPVGSEAVLFAVLRTHANLFWEALALATLGNTLGGMTSYLIGRLIPMRGAPAARHARAIARVRRYGAPVMLGAWLPLVGDPLCVAAGWLRMSWLPVLLFMAAGKFARYLAIAWTAT